MRFYQLWCLGSVCPDAKKSDIEAANEATSVELTAGWPEPIIPVLSTPPPFMLPYGLPSEELMILHEAHYADACLYRE